MLPFINFIHESHQCQTLHEYKMSWKLDSVLFQTAVSTTAKLNVPSFGGTNFERGRKQTPALWEGSGLSRHHRHSLLSSPLGDVSHTDHPSHRLTEMKGHVKRFQVYLRSLGGLAWHCHIAIAFPYSSQPYLTYGGEKQQLGKEHGVI